MAVLPGASILSLALNFGLILQQFHGRQFITKQTTESQQGQELAQTAANPVGVYAKL